MNEYNCDETIYPEDIRFEAWNIMSASQSNPLNQASLDYHAQFPMENCAPILGYLDEIFEEDIGKYFIDGREVRHEDIGLKVFMVERGHHRAFTAAAQGILVPCALNHT